MKKFYNYTENPNQFTFWNKLVQENVILAPFTTFKIGGSAKYFVEVETVIQLEMALRFARQESIPVFVLGKGSNVLINSKGFEGLVVYNKARRIVFQGNLLRVASGVSIREIIVRSIERGFSGFEHFAGIPSTIGGALWQNIHFLSPDRTRTIFIDEIFESARVFNFETGQAKILSKADFCFGYDESILRQNENLIVLSAWFKLEKKSRFEIVETIVQNLAWRNERHPPYYREPSAGSIFKKVDNVGAGRLIEEVGLKGFSVGGAMISPKHANFIINTGNATSDDVLGLINKIQERVHRITGHELETEIKFVGI